jgi:hypothetical protein
MKKKPNSRKAKRLAMRRTIERPQFSDSEWDGLMNVPTAEAIEGYTAMMARMKAIQEAALHLAMAKRARRQARNLAQSPHGSAITGA